MRLLSKHKNFQYQENFKLQAIIEEKKSKDAETRRQYFLRAKEAKTKLDAFLEVIEKRRLERIQEKKIRMQKRF